jgi:hypothetical protein
MDYETLKERIHVAIHEFKRTGSDLIDVNSSERSMTFLLGSILYKDELLSEYNIDCEYSRDGQEAKRLLLPYAVNNSNELSPRIVYPDIIIHKRRTNINLLVIEAKKEGLPNTYDQLKIHSFLQEFEYTFGLLLTIPRTRNGHFILQWQHLNAKKEPCVFDEYII